MKVILNDIQVMYVKADDSPEGPKKAFDKLESHLSSLKGRKFYGTYHAGEYRACLAIRPEEEPSCIGLDTWIIPGGQYARRKIKDWPQRLSEIEKTFAALAEEYSEDPERPSIEFYRSMKELILYLPIIGS